MTKEEFYKFTEGEMWRVCCPYCKELIEGKPHYRDAEDENDYIICPKCGNKLYVAE